MTLRPGQSDYAYPAEPMCHVFSLPLYLEGDGAGDNPALIWSKDIVHGCTEGPTDEFPSDGDMCDYWSSEVTQVYGVAPWIFLSEVRLDDDHLVFRWDDCFYKFAALKLPAAVSADPNTCKQLFCSNSCVDHKAQILCHAETESSQALGL